MKKTFLTTLTFLVVAVAILTVVLLLGNSEETTLSEPESSAEVAPAVITRIDLNTKNIKLKPGDTQKLEFSVYPAGADSKGVTITSSDDNIVHIVNGSMEALADGEAVVSVCAENGVSASCNICVETPYKIKDKRNVGFYELGNGEILEYCCEYKDYILSVSQMTGYQFENRSHEKDGLYVHLSGIVRAVNKNGTIYIEAGRGDGSPLAADFLEADLALTDYQSDLLFDLKPEDTIEAFAVLDDYSFDNRSDMLYNNYLFTLHDGIIVKLNAAKTTIPSDFKPKLLGLSDENGSNEYALSNSPTKAKEFPCIGSYSNGDDTITISKTEDGVLYISIADSQGIIVQGTAYYSVDDPYSEVTLYTDYGKFEILPYKPDYSFFVSVDGTDAGTFIRD